MAGSRRARARRVRRAHPDPASCQAHWCAWARPAQQRERQARMGEVSRVGAETGRPKRRRRGGPPQPAQPEQHSGQQAWMPQQRYHWAWNYVTLWEAACSKQSQAAGGGCARLDGAVAQLRAVEQAGVGHGVGLQELNVRKALWVAHLVCSGRKGRGRHERLG